MSLIPLWRPWPDAARRAGTALRKTASAAAALGLAAPLASLMAGMPAHAAEPLRWQIGLHSERHSDATPLAALSGADPFEHLAPRHGANLAYVDDEVRAGVARGPWQLSLLARNHGSLVANRDALEIAAQVEGRGAVLADRDWQPHVRFLAFTGAGLALQHEWRAAEGWQARLGVQALSLRRWRARALDGAVQWRAAAQQYAFDLQSMEEDDRLEFPFQDPSASHGSAALFDGAIAWQGSAGAARLEWRDLGWLRWRALPRQQASLVSNRVGSDANGFFIYGPLVEGRNLQNGYTRRLNGTLVLSGELALDGAGRQALTAGLRRIDGWGPWLPALGWQGRFGTGLVRATWMAHERRLDLAFQGGGWELGLGADAFGARAHSQTLRLAYQFAH